MSGGYMDGDDDFHPATMEDDVIYIGTRKYVAADRASQVAPAPSDGLREAAEHALDAVQKFMSGQSVTADEKALADRVAMAACFAAEAYNHACMEEDGIYGLHQSFLRALVDPLHPGLDYLRDDPSTGPAARAALTPAPAQEGPDKGWPPQCCTAWEDCKIDGICHDPECCSSVGPNARNYEDQADD